MILTALTAITDLAAAKIPDRGIPRSSQAGSLAGKIAGELGLMGVSSVVPLERDRFSIP